MEACGRALGAISCEWLARVEGRSIPEDEPLTPHVAQEHAQAADHTGGVIGVVRHRHHPPPIAGDAADRRELVEGEGHVPHGRRSPWRPAPLPRWQPIEARFLYPDDVLAFVGCLFFLAAQRGSYQRRTASSSRWVARSSGRGTLQPC